MRLLLCLDCKSVEPLPDYDGPPENDSALEHLLAPHRRADHRGTLANVADEEWDDPVIRGRILEVIKERTPGGKSPWGTGLGTDVYAVKDTLHDEAMRCFNAHNRPKGTCIDWQDRSKRLGNQLLTEEEKREKRDADIPKMPLSRGVLPIFNKKSDQFLCSWCPVASTVQEKKFEKQGFYN